MKNVRSFLLVSMLIFLFSASVYPMWKIEKSLFTVALDFGDKKSSVAENFTPINQDTIYSEEKGYGWEKQYKGIYSISTAGLTSTANKDGLASTEEASLIIKMPDGVYKGIITPFVAGKDVTRLYQYSLFGNGELLLERVELPERTFTVKVTDGKLKLTFKPVKNGWSVHSIVLMPVENFLKYPEEFEKAKRLLVVGDDEKIAKMELPELNYNKTPFPPFANQDIIIFKKSITDKIVPTTRPEKEEIIKKIELKAAGDEYESYQFGILSKKPVLQLRFKVSDLKGKKSRIPSENINIRTHYYFTYKGGLNPKTLDLREEIELIPNYTQGLWLTAYVPPDTPADVYKGNISIYGTGIKEIKLPLEITVLPFNLPEPKRHFYNIMWLGTYDTKPDSPAQEICKMAILDQKAHGINAFGCELRYPACNIYKEGNEIKFDLKPLEDRINLYKSLGIDLNPEKKFIWRIGIRPEKELAELTGTDTRILDKYIVEPLLFPEKFLDVYAKIVKSVEEYAKKNNLPEMYLFNIDEPYGVYKNRVALQLVQATKKGGGHPWVTVNDTYYEPLKEYLDVPVFANGYASYKTYEEYKKAGKKFWFYSAAPRGLRPVYARYETGLYLFKVGFEGATWFVYTWSLGNAYNGLESMWNAVHPGFWEFVPTISWECTREGIDDVRYMEFLEDLLKKNPDEKTSLVLKSLLDIVDPDINNFLHIDPVTDVLVGKEASTWKSRDLDMMREFLQDSCSQMVKKVATKTEQKAVKKPKNIEIKFGKNSEEKPKIREVEFYDSSYICSAPVVGLNSVKIDGEIDEIWSKAYKIENFVKLQYFSKEAPLAEDKTEVYLLRDSENLYMFFKCFTKDMTKVKATISSEKRDIKEMWREDGIEIFIDPDCQFLTYYQIMINANGALTDMKVSISEKKEDDLNWNSDILVKTKRFKDFWTAEIKMPISSFGNYEVWGINFCRNNSQEKGVHTLWRPTIKPSLGNQGFGVPEKFGKLVLSGKIDKFKMIKKIDGELPVYPLGTESKIIIDVDSTLAGKSIRFSILDNGKKKIFEKEIPAKQERIEIPFMLFQTNEDPIYYLSVKTDGLELGFPFRFLSKDVNFIVFPSDAFLIYSSKETETRLKGMLKVSQEILKKKEAKMEIILKDLSGKNTLFNKEVPLSSDNFEITLPLKELDSGAYTLEVNVNLDSENALKTRYNFLKL